MSKRGASCAPRAAKRGRRGLFFDLNASVGEESSAEAELEPDGEDLEDRSTDEADRRMAKEDEANSSDEDFVPSEDEAGEEEPLDVASSYWTRNARCLRSTMEHEILLPRSSM